MAFGTLNTSSQSNLALFRHRLRLARKRPVAKLERMCRRRVGVRVSASQRLSPKGPGSCGQGGGVLGDFKTVVGARTVPIDRKDACAKQAMECMHELSARDVAHVFNCCKKGGYVNNELFQELAHRVLCCPKFVGDFSAIEMSMTIQSLGVLYRRVGRSDRLFGCFQSLLEVLVEECLMREKSGFKQFNVQSTANVVHGLGLIYGRKGEFQPGEKVAGLLDTVLRKFVRKRALRRAKLQEMSNVLHGCANVGFRDDDVLRALCNGILARLKTTSNHLERASAKPMYSLLDVSSTIWALGKLGFRHTEVLEALSRKVVENVDRFQEQALANILYGYGQLQFQSNAALLALCEEVSRRERLGRFTTQGLSNIVYALAQLRWKDVVALDALSLEIGTAPRLDRFKEQELSNILYGFGLLEYKNAAVLKGVVGQLHSPSRLSRLTDQHVCNILWGLGKLQYFDDQALIPLLQKVRDEVPAFSAQHIASVGYGIASLKPLMDFELVSLHVEPIFRTIAESIRRGGGLGEFNAHAASTLCWAFAEVRFYDPGVVDRLVSAFLGSATGDGHVSPAGVCMMLHACATFGRSNREFLSFFDDWLECNLATLEGDRRACTVMWDLAVLGTLDAPTFSKLCGLLDGSSVEGASVSQCRQVAQAWMDVTAMEAAACAPVVRRMVSVAGAEASGEVSGLEGQVERVLRALGLSVEPQKAVMDGRVVVDFWVAVEGGGEFVVEVDGPSHFSINRHAGRHHIMGQTKFRNRIMERAGFKVVCIPYFEWQGLSLSKQKEWLRRAFLC